MVGGFRFSGVVKDEDVGDRCVNNHIFVSAGFYYLISSLGEKKKMLLVFLLAMVLLIILIYNDYVLTQSEWLVSALLKYDGFRYTKIKHI